VIYEQDVTREIPHLVYEEGDVEFIDHDEVEHELVAQTKRVDKNHDVHEKTGRKVAAKEEVHEGEEVAMDSNTTAPVLLHKSQLKGKLS